MLPGTNRIVKTAGTGDEPTALNNEPLTIAGAALGTVGYMSPEQVRGEELDARTDLFSLGIVLYEMATGQLPFSGDTAALVFDGILHKTPKSPLALNPELPSEFSQSVSTTVL
jgi:eukaryotic-like serine/threonine-protein kinase